MSETVGHSRFLTAEEAGTLLNFPPNTIRRMARQKLLPATRVGRRGWRFSSTAIEEWSRKGGAAPAAMWLRRNTDLEIGNWRFDSRRFVINHRTDPGGDIDVEEMTTSAQTLDWIFHLAGKVWVSREDVGDLVELLRQTVDPQATLCSWGRERGPRKWRTDVPGVLFVEKRTKRSEIANYQTLCADSHTIPVVVTHSGPGNMKIAVDLKVVRRLLRPEGLERVRAFLLEQLGEGEWQQGGGWTPTLISLGGIPLEKAPAIAEGLRKIVAELSITEFDLQWESMRAKLPHNPAADSKPIETQAAAEPQEGAK